MLTVTTNILNTIGGPTTRFAMGQRMEWDITFISNGIPVNFENLAIFFNPALWLESALPNNNIVDPPQQGYSAQLGTAPETGFMEVIPGAYTLPWDNIRVEYRLTNATTLSIKLIFINGFDLCSYMENAVLNNTARLSKSNIRSDSAFVNFEDSVYNKEKAMKGHLVLADTVTQTVYDQVFAEYLVENHYFESGVAGGAPLFTDWSFSLERNGEVVPDLSTYENTILKVQIDTGGNSLSLDSQLTTYRSDNINSQVGLEKDLKLGINDSTGPKEGIEYVAVYTPWALVGGTIYEAQWELKASEFDYGGSYTFIVVNSNLPRTEFNSASTRTDLPATACPAPVTGTMTGEIKDYNAVYTNDCLQVTAYERIQSCVNVDKASYLIELALASLPGNFNFNFQNVRVRLILLDNDLTDPFNPANTVIVDVNNEVGDPALEITSNADDYKSCLTFRTQPEWANTPFVVIHTYTYRIPVLVNTYEDIIHYRQLFNLNGLEEDTGNNFLTGMTFEDQAGNPVIEICEDFNGPLVVKVQKVPTLPTDYNLIAAIKKDNINAPVDEEESYTNNVLDQSSSPLLLNVDALFGIDDEAVFEVDDSLLETGQKYRIIAIAKQEDGPLAACPIIGIETDTLCTLVTGIPAVSFTGDYDISFNIINFGPSTITSVDITTNNDPFNSGPQINNFLAVSSGTYAYSVTIPVGDPALTEIEMDIVVTLSNGCVYRYTANHSVIFLPGSTTQDGVSVEAD